MSATGYPPEQIAAALALLELVDSSRGAGQPTAGPAVSDNSIDADGGASTGEAPMCRTKIYRDRKKWRVRVVDTATGAIKNHIFETEELALAGRKRLEREYRRPIGVPMPEALQEYRQHLTRKGNRARSIETTMGRIQCLFTGDGLTGELTPDAVASVWERFTTTDGSRSGKTPSTDTKVGVLKQCRTFLRWVEGRGWLKQAGLLDGIIVEGRRAKGKPKFTAIEDDSRVFLAKALELADAGDTGAVAAAMGLVMGMRASEIADRLVGDLDDGGRKLSIPHAKTMAGIRRLMIPEVLQPLLRKVADKRGRGERLFGEVNRHWVLRAVRRVCKDAGLKVISAHGLRGVHAELAVAAGVTGDIVAASLGHESFNTTAQHYAGGEAVAGARVARVAQTFH
jgi:integrase